LESYYEQIKLLKKDASDKKIFSKASKLAKLIGSCQSMTHGYHYNYDCNGLKIWYDEYGPNLSITWLNKHEVFFYQLGETTRYRPDVEGWLTELEFVYGEMVKPKMDAEALTVQRAKEEEIADRWGISIDCVQKDVTKE
jgi:hypothetical protein